MRLTSLRCSQSRLQHNHGRNPLSRTQPAVQTNRASSADAVLAAQIGDGDASLVLFQYPDGLFWIKSRGKVNLHPTGVARRQNSRLPSSCESSLSAQTLLQDHREWTQKLA
jgi:hypothetical protein